MNERRTHEPPPPRGAGAGGGGRAEPSAPLDAARENIPTGNRSEGSIGWGPNAGQTRQREFLRATDRAKRLRKELTPSERALWLLLREIPGAHFRKQVAIDNRVFDFAECGARLLIELDGLVHNDPEVEGFDQIKQGDAESAGFRVLRFTNAEVAMRPHWVVEQVRACLNAPHPPAPAPQGGGGEENA